MKNVLFYLVLIVSIVSIYGFMIFLADNDQPIGKKLFIENKCNMCHTVNLANITSRKSDALDISQISKDKPTEFWINYLMKKEKLNDKDHKTAFKGIEEDLVVIIEWLKSLSVEQ